MNIRVISVAVAMAWGAAAAGAQGRVTGTPVPGAERPLGVVVPAGVELDIKLKGALKSGVVKPDERFEAATLVDVTVAGVLAIPAGSVARGFVGSVRPAGRLERRGSLTLSFDELRIGERPARLRASIVQAFDPKMSEDLTRIGPGAIASGASGGMLGGGKAPLVGVLVGGGAVSAAQAGDVELPAGAVLRIRLEAPIDVVR